MSNIPYEAGFTPAPHAISYSQVRAALLDFIATCDRLKKELDALPQPRQVPAEQLERFAVKASDLSEKLRGAELALEINQVLPSRFAGMKPITNWESLSERAMDQGRSYRERAKAILSAERERRREEELVKERQEEFRQAEAAYLEAVEAARRGEIPLSSVGSIPDYLPKKRRGPSPGVKGAPALSDAEEGETNDERDRRERRANTERWAGAGEELIRPEEWPDLDPATEGGVRE